jgi:hypothetical protein
MPLQGIEPCSSSQTESSLKEGMKATTHSQQWLIRVIIPVWKSCTCQACSHVHVHSVHCQLWWECMVIRPNIEHWRAKKERKKEKEKKIEL